MIDPSSRTGIALRMYGGLVMGLFGTVMAVYQAISPFGDKWSMLGMSFAALVGFLVFVGVRRERHSAD